MGRTLCVTETRIGLSSFGAGVSPSWPDTIPDKLKILRMVSFRVSRRLPSPTSYHTVD